MTGAVPEGDGHLVAQRCISDSQGSGYVERIEDTGGVWRNMGAGWEWLGRLDLEDIAMLRAAVPKDPAALGRPLTSGTVIGAVPINWQIATPGGVVTVEVNYWYGASVELDAWSDAFSTAVAQAVQREAGWRT